MAEKIVDYTFLSNNCGLKVSNIGLGTMTFGDDAELPLPGNLDEEHSHQILDRYAELGGNFIDAANIYSQGKSERYIGDWLTKKGDRERFVVQTKCRFNMDATDPNNTGLSRKSIVRALTDSLERLQTHYVDILMIHCWDTGVPIEETLRTLSDLVRTGKVLYVGGSNLTGWQMQKIVDYNRFMGFPQFVTLQNQYNLLTREMEYELFDVCRNEGIGLQCWGPLKSGLLGGTVSRDSKKPPPGSRLAWAQGQDVWDELVTVSENLNSDKYWNIINVLEGIAKQHGKTKAQVALRWALQRPPVSTVIIGAKCLSQLEENMGAGAGWSLTDDQMELLNKASAIRLVDPYIHFYKENLDRQHPGIVSNGML